MVIEKYLGPNTVEVRGSKEPKLNLLSYDFLGMASRKELKAAAKVREPITRPHLTVHRQI